MSIFSRLRSRRQVKRSRQYAETQTREKALRQIATEFDKAIVAAQFEPNAGKQALQLDAIAQEIDKAVKEINTGLLTSAAQKFINRLNVQKNTASLGATNVINERPVAILRSDVSDKVFAVPHLKQAWDKAVIATFIKENSVAPKTGLNGPVL